MFTKPNLAIFNTEGERIILEISFKFFSIFQSMLRLCRPSPHLVSLCRVSSILAWVSSHELVFELKTRNCLAFCGFTLLSLFWVPSLGNGAPAWVFAVWNLFTRAKQLMRRSDKPVSGSPSTQPSITSLLLPPLASEKSCQQGRAREGKGGGEEVCPWLRRLFTTRLTPSAWYQANQPTLEEAKMGSYFWFSLICFKIVNGTLQMNFLLKTDWQGRTLFGRPIILLMDIVRTWEESKH